MSKFDIKDFKGVIPAVLTPFDENEEIDELGMRQLVSYLIEKGVDGLYITGSTGEGFTMSNEERKRVAEIVMDETQGRVPVVVHIGAIGTKLSIELAKHAEEIGADGISSVPPFYWSFNEDQIVKYYTEIAEACSVPMIVYNVPLVGLLGMKAIKRLAQIENVRGIKYTALAHHEISQIKDEIGQDFLVYSGADEMAISGLLSGSDGIIGSFYNVMPELFINMNKAVASREIDEAISLQRQARAIIIYCLQLPSFYAGMKAILRWRGINAGYCRSPFQNLDEAQEKEFREGLKNLKETYNITAIEFLDEI